MSNPNRRSYAILSYYFGRITYLLAEVLNEGRSWDDRLWLARYLGTDMLRGWMVPKLEQTWHD